MAKPHRRSKASSQKPRRRPHRARADGPGVTRRPGRDVAGLEQYGEPFRQWLRDVPPGPSDPELGTELEAAAAQDMWGAVQTVFTVASITGLDPDPSLWSPDDVDDLVTALREVAQELDPLEPSGRDDAAGALIGALSAFLTFLNETDRWEGTEGAMFGILTQLTLAAEPDGDFAQFVAASRTGDDVTEDEESAALAALPLVADVVDLLAVVAERQQAGSPLTPAGVEEDVLTGLMTSRTGADDDARSLYHVWIVALVTDLVALDGGHASLTPKGEQLAASPLALAQETRRVVHAWLLLLLTASGVVTADVPVVEAAVKRVTAFVMPVLALGLSERPARVVDEDAALDDVTADVPETLRGPVRGVLRVSLGRLVRAGILTVDDGRYVVPRGLEPIVVQAMDSATHAEASSGGGAAG